MLAPDNPRPAKLYLYAERERLERALTFGEFPLAPLDPQAAVQSPGSEAILPFRRTAGALASGRSYLVLRLTQSWSEENFNLAAGTDCCLVIHDPEQFGERIHRAAQSLLPDWAGIDAAVSYGRPSPLGLAFSQDRQFAEQKEWLFAWRPTMPGLAVSPIVIQIGTIESIAELRGKSN